MRSFAKLSIDLSKKIGCSYWIDELNAIADTAGIDRELYIAFTFGRYRDLALLYKGVGCTTFAVTPPATKNGRIIFHKTRETAPDLQSGYLKRITGVQGTDRQPYKFFGEMGTADTGISFFVNEKGLAGGADVPSQWQNRECYVGSYKGTLPFVTPPKYDGFMNHYVPRYMPSTAGTLMKRKKPYILLRKRDTSPAGNGARTTCSWMQGEKSSRLQTTATRSSRSRWTRLWRRTENPGRNLLHRPQGERLRYTRGCACISIRQDHVELVNSPGWQNTPPCGISRGRSPAPPSSSTPNSRKNDHSFRDPSGLQLLHPLLHGGECHTESLADGTVYSVQKDSYRYSEFYEAG